MRIRCRRGVARHGRWLLHWVAGVHVMMALVLECCMVGELLGQRLDMLARRTADGIGTLDLGVDGLVQTAELQLLLGGGVVEQLLLSAALGRVEGIVVLLVGLRRRRVVGHLCEHPVVHLELR